MSVIQNGDFIHLTGFDALKYEYNTCKGIKGIINAIISFFLGRKITLFEGQSLLKDYVPNDPPMSKLSERRASETLPAVDSRPLIMIDLKADSSSESQTVDEDITKVTPEDMATPDGITIPDDMATPEDIVAGTEKSARSPREILDDFDHVFGREREQLIALNDGSDYFNTQPEPLHEGILDALKLCPDFLDQEDKEIIAWLDSSNFMDNAASTEMATLIKHIIYCSVYENNKNLFIDICASLGSRANHPLYIRSVHKNLDIAFFGYYKHLMSNDDQSSSKACRVIGAVLINELDSYLKQIKPPKSQHKAGLSEPNLRWMDYISSSEHGVAIDENQLIDISHGGGQYYLKKFLNGEVNGYKLERGSDTGLQIHPYMAELVGRVCLSRDIIKNRQRAVYSERSLQYLDLPARLTAKIPVKHVIAARSLYEAAILPCSVCELVTPEITSFDDTPPSEATDLQEPET